MVECLCGVAKNAIKLKINPLKEVITFFLPCFAEKKAHGSVGARTLDPGNDCRMINSHP